VEFHPQNPPPPVILILHKVIASLLDCVRKESRAKPPQIRHLPFLASNSNLLYLPISLKP